MLIRRFKKKKDGTAPKIYTPGVRRTRRLSDAVRIMVALNRHCVSRSRQTVSCAKRQIIQQIQNKRNPFATLDINQLELK